MHSVLLYGSKTRALKTNTMNRLETFEMSRFKRLVKIPWTQHSSNEVVVRLKGI